ncbi:uncharacterized protein METZ01_LOCUS360656, partial [marine metagenome]
MDLFYLLQTNIKCFINEVFVKIITR